MQKLVLIKWTILLVLISNNFFSQNENEKKFEKGFELSTFYNNRLGVDAGFTFFRVKSGGYTFILNKFSTGIEYNFDGSLEHYLQYSSMVMFVLYGVRTNQFIDDNSQFGLKVMPFVGLSLAGRYSLFVGYNFSSDIHKNDTFTFGLNFNLSFSKFFRPHIENDTED